MKNSLTTTAYCLLAFFCFIAIPNHTIAQDPYEFLNYYDDDNDYLPGELRDVVTPAIVAAPNPSTEAYLKIWYNQLEQTSKLTLNDISGKQVHAAEIGGENGKREGMYKIPVMNLPKGVYVVSLSSGIYKMTKKVLIH